MRKIPRVPLRLTATMLLLCAFGASAMAQQAGVLLGYGELASDGGYQYKTVWIVFWPTEARVAATVPDVIVILARGQDHRLRV